MLKIYHNHQCSKSRSAKTALTTCDIPFEVVEYLSQPLDFEQLKSLYAKMEGIEAKELCREKLQENATDDDILRFIAENPSSMQRPIIESDNKAIIARQSELVEEFLNEIKEN